jgi:DNA primase
MAFSDAFLQELAEKNEIVDVVSGYVRLTKKSGANLFGLCPFHSEKTPSFSVSPEKQIYHCFGCGKGGGVIGFIMEIENLPFADAVAFLARRAGMELPEEGRDEAAVHRRRLLELCREAAHFFRERLTAPEGRPARDYMTRRGIEDSVSLRFGLGFAPDGWNGLMDAMKAKGYSERELFDAGLMKKGRNGGGYDAFRNRLMFPVIDVRGAVIGFSGRVLGEGEPKYLNSPETPIFSKGRNLFALNLAKKSKSGYIILSEGNIDVVSLHQAGFDSAVASLGTSLTPEQARLIARFTGEVVIAYDSDEAGKKASQRAIGILEKLDLKVRILALPEAKDPDEYIRLKGAEAFRRVLEGSQTQVEYRLRLVLEKHDLKSDEGKVAFLKDALKLLAELPGAVEREVYALRVAETAGVSKDAVLAEVKRLRKQRLDKAKAQEEREGTRPTGTVQPASRGLRYSDLRAARAEEGLVRLLYLDPDLLRGRDLPPPEKFTSALLGRFYGELLLRARNGAPLSPSVLAGSFTPEEIGHLTEILQRPETLSNAEKALGDYIDIIEGAGTGTSQEELLELAQKKYRQAMGYGG